MRSQEENSAEASGVSHLYRVLGWPLRQLMNFALDHPSLLQAGTRLVSKFPFIYNLLLRFAQRNKIVLAPEEPSADPFQIDDPGELTESGKAIYGKLRNACMANRESAR